MTLSRRQQIRARTDGLNNIRTCLACGDYNSIDAVTCTTCGWLLVMRVAPSGRAKDAS